MRSRHKRQRVTRAASCSVCGRPDHRGRSQNGAMAIGMRVESPWRTKNGGRPHRLAHRLPARAILKRLIAEAVRGERNPAVRGWLDTNPRSKD